MIDAIELKDWEGHKESILELSDTVTVILGKSHNGKSSIVRAIDWVLNNRPVSTVYFPRGNKKPESTVSISTDEGFISRIRNKKKNYYETDDGIFTALRSGVPDEVKDFLGMTEINLQLQKDVHYMLTDTPGKRAKRLNEIAGLSEMDKAMESINKLHRAVKTQYDAKVMVLKDHKDDLHELDWVTKAEKDFEQLEKLDKKSKELSAHIDKADFVIDKIETIRGQQNRLPDTTALKPIKVINELDDHLYGLDVKIDNIKKRLRMISKLEQEIKDVNLPDDDEFQNLHTKNAELSVLKNKCKFLNLTLNKINDISYELILAKDRINLHTKNVELLVFKDKAIILNENILTIDNLTYELGIAKNEIKIHELERDKFMDKFSICPFCKQEIEDTY